jgi:hypothetical protein
MRNWLTLLAVTSLAALPATAADPPPVRLFVKPLLCVVDKAATSCNVLFDIRWTSVLPGEYCLSDETTTPLRCWPSADSGELQHRREVSEDFIFWLAPPAGTQRAAEVKVEVLRVGSDDRRRERRTRHVWDVL